YFKEVDVWCNLNINVIINGIDYQNKFINYVLEYMKLNNIDNTNGIPNKVWYDCYKSFSLDNNLINISNLNKNH
ncbi:MAG: hypothetical protein PHH93_12850, partial [Prolixibacteraceae bacterium]|nr:hypothetical protein [Prolixibacteraceae bacterium]